MDIRTRILPVPDMFRKVILLNSRGPFPQANPSRRSPRYRFRGKAVEQVWPCRKSDFRGWDRTRRMPSFLIREWIGYLEFDSMAFENFQRIGEIGGGCLPVGRKFRNGIDVSHIRFVWTSMKRRP